MSDALFNTIPVNNTTAPWNGFSRQLPGPHEENKPFHCRSAVECARLVIRESENGSNVYFLQDFAVSRTGDSATNFMISMVVFESAFHLIDVFVLGHENDCERVARKHVKKSRLYGNSFLKDGVLSTKDNVNWKTQRTHLVTSLLPSVLKQVMPTSVSRAQFSVGRLQQLMDTDGVVDLSEFFLHEAMAQLHLSLFGEETEFSENANCKLRQSFTTLLDGPFKAASKEDFKDAFKFQRGFSEQVLQRAAQRAPQCPVARGPVAASMLSNPVPTSVQIDTATTFSFAGHDTTANLMTFLTCMMCLHPRLYARLQDEVDALFDENVELTYEHWHRMPFLTRCINETLRLYPSVPNGTFRELESDEQVTGPTGPVLLKKGSQVWITSHLLHRSKRLWGSDADLFNPDRKWLPEELFGGSGAFGAQIPRSHRYCPFTFPPRSCIGLNFAQMESRVVLCTLFRHFRFELAEPTKSFVEKSPLDRLGFNNGTQSVRGGLFCIATPRAHRKAKL